MTSSPPSPSNSGSSSTMRHLLMITFGLALLAFLNNVRKIPEASSNNDEWQLMRSARVLQLPVSNKNNVTVKQLISNTDMNVTTQKLINKMGMNGAGIVSTDGVAVGTNNDNSTTESDFFSACLLTKDDSHFLIEWLAYHYHTLPLRHLIVAVDPNSKTSPSFIFEKWRKQGMTIEEWTDTDFIGKTSMINQTGTKAHRYRQKKFVQSCLKKLKRDKRTWTLLVDVDEYLSYNTYTRNLTSDLHQPATFMSFLKEELPKSENETKLHSQSPCIMMPRLRYGSVESTPQQVTRDVPSGFNATAFQTLRYRFHGKPNARKLYGAGKTIIDISQIDDIHTSNPHRPVKTCSKDVFKKVKRSSLVVRHYLGSWEQFTFRADARQEGRAIETGMKSKQTYDKVSDLNHEADDAIRPWLQGFVDDVGIDTAMELLDGVGDVSIAPAMTKL